MKKKPTPPNISVVESAWAAFLQEGESADTEALRADGWRTVKDLAEESGRGMNSIDHQIRRNRDKFDQKSVRVMVGGGMRNVMMYRPKVGG
jgi:hypothetical protein